MNVKIYVEGGGTSRILKDACREGFKKLLEKCEYTRMPRLVACGSRNATFDDFKTAIANMRPGDFVAMWIDSEDPIMISKPHGTT